MASPLPDAILPIKCNDGTSCSLANVTALSTMFPETTELACSLPAATTLLASRAGFDIAPVPELRLNAPLKVVAVKLPLEGL